MAFSLSSRTFSALRIPRYRWYWLGLVATYLAMHIQNPTQSWLAYRMTDSPFLLGLVTAAWGLPLLFLSLFGGVIADRLPKRKILVVCRIVAVVISLCVAVLLSMNRLEFWHLLVASLLNGITAAFSMSALQSIIPELVPRDLTQNAVALGATAFNTSRIAGPAISGILIGTAGSAVAYYISVGFYLIGIVFLVFMPALKSRPSSGPICVFPELIDGLRYLRSNRLLLTAMIIELVIALFSMVYLSFMPIFSDLLGADAFGYGILTGVGGIGALAGALVLASTGDFRNKGATVLLAAFVMGVLTIVFAWQRLFPVAIILLILIGAAGSSFYAINNTILQMNSDERMRGRVMSVYSMISGLQPLALLPIGALAEVAGAPLSVTLSGAIIVVFMVFIWFYKPLYRQNT